MYAGIDPGVSHHSSRIPVFGHCSIPWFDDLHVEEILRTSDLLVQVKLAADLH